MIDVTCKHDTRKLLPRKSTRVAPSIPILDEPLKHVEVDALAQAEATVEKVAKEKLIEKQKAQKQVEADQVVETKGKSIVEGSKKKRKERVKKTLKKGK